MIYWVKPKIKHLFILVFLLMIFVLPSQMEAQGIDQLCPGTTIQVRTGQRCPLTNPAPQYLVSNSIREIVAKIIQILLAFAGAIAVIFLIIGGYQYVASRGNEESMEKAKRTIQSAIIGIIIIVMAYAIVVIVNKLLTEAPPG